MNNELNDILDKKVQMNNPFKVPEGYFDTLSSRIMDNIPEEAEIVVMKPRKARTFGLGQLRWAAAIACILIAGVSVTLYSLRTNTNADEFGTDVASKYLTSSDDALMQAADYTMMDNQDFYQLIAED